jgi:hypothetical protein
MSIQMKTNMDIDTDMDMDLVINMDTDTGNAHRLWNMAAHLQDNFVISLHITALCPQLNTVGIQYVLLGLESYRSSTRNDDYLFYMIQQSWISCELLAPSSHCLVHPTICLCRVGLSIID